MTILEPPSETRWLVTVGGGDEPDAVNEVHDASELARVVAVAAMLGKATRIVITTPGTPVDPHAERWTLLRLALDQMNENGGYYDRTVTVPSTGRLMDEIEKRVPVRGATP